jgi:hypothetical protein
LLHSETGATMKSNNNVSMCTVRYNNWYVILKFQYPCSNCVHWLQRHWPRVHAAFNTESWNCRHTQHKLSKLQFKYPCCNCVQHVLRYLVTKLKYSCSNCVPSFQPCHWPRVYAVHERLPSSYNQCNVQWFWLCDCEFWLQYTVKVCCFVDSGMDCNIFYCVFLFWIVISYVTFVPCFDLYSYCLWYPNWDFFRVFPSVIRQMPGYNSSKTGHGPHLYIIYIYIYI